MSKSTKKLLNTIITALILGVMVQFAWDHDEWGTVAMIFVYWLWQGIGVETIFGL